MTTSHGKKFLLNRITRCTSQRDLTRLIDSINPRYLEAQVIREALTRQKLEIERAGK